MGKIAEIMAKLQAVMDEAPEGTDLTDEQVQRYEALEVELRAAQKSEEIQKRNAAYQTVVTAPLHTTAKPEADTLERAFNAFLRSGVPNADIVQLRAQSEGTPTAGGYLVPDTFRQKLVEKRKAFGGLQNVVENITTSTGANMSWPTFDDTANEGDIVPENAQLNNGADLVFGEADLGAYKYMSGGAGNLPLRVSVELLQDAAFDIEGLITRALGKRIARKQARHWVSGTGVGQPLGIITNKTGIEPAAAVTPTYTDLVKFKHALDPEYREGARWAFNDTTLALFEGKVDSDGRPLLAPMTDANFGDAPGGMRLLGYPVTIDQAFPDFSAASDTVNWGVFGNLMEAYVIRRVREIVVVVNPYSRAEYGQVEYTAWERADGTVQDPNAYVALTGYTA